VTAPLASERFPVFLQDSWSRMTELPPTPDAGPVLVTGGAGFFGGLLARRLLKAGQRVVTLDLHAPDFTHPNLTAVRGDIRDAAMLRALFDEHRFPVVHHCAAILAHAVKDERVLWESNVDATGLIAEHAARIGTRALVFTSSNCLWARGFGRPVREDDEPDPVEIYGRSKWEAEKLLAAFAGRLPVTIIRCPTIMDEGRLGLLAILFEFITEGRRLWAIGGARNRYQFIYAQDLATACIAAAAEARTLILHIGSDDVPTLAEAYQYVIDRAGTGARVVGVPRAPAVAALRLAHMLSISPIGPYQYRMIAEDFVFDTSRIKAELGWRPTLTNGEMLWRAYRYYAENRDEIAARSDVSAHRQVARMGVLRLLKLIS
jgi:nucleoside-diphosphate-sugar epimerase